MERFKKWWFGLETIGKAVFIFLGCIPLIMIMNTLNPKVKQPETIYDKMHIAFEGFPPKKEIESVMKGIMMKYPLQDNEKVAEELGNAAFPPIFDCFFS